MRIYKAQPYLSKPSEAAIAHNEIFCYSFFSVNRKDISPCTQVQICTACFVIQLLNRSNQIYIGPFFVVAHNAECCLS